MLNKIWFWLVVIGILYAPLKSVVRPLLPLPAVEAVVTEEGEAPTPPATFSDLGKTITQSAIDGANVAVDLLLSLIGIMVLWLGLMQVAKDAGLVDGLAYLLRPLMRWLFPDVPEGHPAQGAMLMNISANMLGLDNAATPFGLKAMQDLQELNPEKETTTDAMATFLAINSSSVTIIPIAIIGYRIAAKSENPAGPLAYIMIATLVSTIVAIFTVRLLAKLPRYALKPVVTAPQEEAALMNGFSQAFVAAAELVSQWTIPGVILLIVLAAWWRSVPMYESFVTGAKEGFGVVVMIIPYLVAILFAIKLFLASGIFEDLKWAATKGLESLGLERFAETFELLPLALTKPLSGGASRGVLVDLFDRFGPDSFIGNTGSIMMGSSETTFYILSVYFGSIGIKKFRHTLPACLIADLAGFIAAIALGWMFFA